MNRRHFTLNVLAASAAVASASGCASATGRASNDPLLLNLDKYSTQEITVGAMTLKVRAYEQVPVVTNPVEPEYQCINLYVPEAYFNGGRVGAFDANTAPIFFPNSVGGYMPAKPGTLVNQMPPFGNGPKGAPQGGNGNPPPPPPMAGRVSASAVALSQGYVVAAPGARGRTLQTSSGVWTGKAPAAILDLKAAVRWLRHNQGRIPGNTERIISNGTSAGGALSALLGASGNHPYYEAELKAMGAAPARDDIYAVSAYCPITNLPHADEAYEWQFEGLNEYRNIAMSMLDFRVERKEIVGHLNDQQMALSAQMSQNFVAYVNQLGLRGPDGQPLSLQAGGSGALQTYIASLLVQSAQRALDAGQDLSSATWVTIQGKRVTSLDFKAHVKAAGRMKAQPAFDGFSLETGENQLFGDAKTDKRHFTEFSLQHSTVVGATRADDRTIKAMDAMLMLQDSKATVATHWRIRHGSVDRDTSLAVPTLLAAAARKRGADVDFAIPWGVPHSGDYDLSDLFAWTQAQLKA